MYNTNKSHQIEIIKRISAGIMSKVASMSEKLGNLEQ